ncbi:MAG TPA: hypothetical protein VFQ54_11150, partial [Thermomicrobiales bacterium]|nr:hypothetical protein [Thermomicrobiales bacterium]
MGSTLYPVDESGSVSYNWVGFADITYWIQAYDYNSATNASTYSNCMRIDWGSSSVPTDTPVPPTATSTAGPSPTPTNTVPPTATSSPTNTPTLAPTATATATPVPEIAVNGSTNAITSVQPNDTVTFFYSNVQYAWLYADGTCSYYAGTSFPTPDDGGSTVSHTAADWQSLASGSYAFSFRGFDANGQPNTPCLAVSVPFDSTGAPVLDIDGSTAATIQRANGTGVTANISGATPNSTTTLYTSFTSCPYQSPNTTAVRDLPVDGGGLASASLFGESDTTEYVQAKAESGPWTTCIQITWSAPSTATTAATETPVPTETSTPTSTTVPTQTPTPTITTTPTETLTPSVTPTPSPTPVPSLTINGGTDTLIQLNLGDFFYYQAENVPMLLFFSGGGCLPGNFLNESPNPNSGSFSTLGFGPYYFINNQ